MGFLKGLFGKKDETVEVETPKAAVTIDMSKSKEKLNTVLIDMSKNAKVDMTKHKARVGLAIDYSGSMEALFNDGSVQKTVNRLLPIALRFDDNGELESWLFSNGSKKLKAVNENNYENYVKNVMRKSGMDMGGTNYSPVLRDIVHFYKDREPSEIPSFVIFVTDGENWDQERTTEVIRELSNYNMFVQFVGIGNERFNYLRDLDNLPGRAHDNTGFISVQDMNEMTDEELYTEILRQYKEWLNNK